MITWPAVIKYEGDDELSFMHSQAEWDQDADSHLLSFAEGDVLIDSEGCLFNLNNAYDNGNTPLQSQETLSLSALTEVVRKHASVVGQCCSSKIAFITYRDAIQSIKDVE
ncbi:Uncharacterised protein [BD1-7 clade bacterium]|uniref:Uncharacterized protein n=1 Tax=BD1-7 clade bacterium TaxID=2029982 RepID=A0A5S9PI22_9GAMM|nr:Uncharacterised protein [BD1-7 clade bacterium]CAA0103393.1 Uncharacterised protein [BD1-7 clade bacterium]